MLRKGYVSRTLLRWRVKKKFLVLFTNDTLKKFFLNFNLLGRWNPLLVLLAALFFGAASALQFQAQTLGLAVPYQLFLAFPYLLTLLALAGWVGKSRAPASLALPWPRES